MYVPVLHPTLLGLIEAPGYFLMGCHSDFLSTIKLVEGLVVVDLDKGKVTTTQDYEWPFQLPLKAAGKFCAKVSKVR